MPSFHFYAAPVAVLMLLSGCETARVTPVEELDAAVSVMTQTDVTQVPGNEAAVRRAVSRDQGYGTALRSAILQNQQFEAAILRYRATSAGIEIARSAARPQLSGDATAGAVAEGERDFDVTTGAAAGVSLSQLIYDGGRTRANVAEAEAQAYAARATVAATGNEVGRDAALAWIDLWNANAQLALLRERVNEVSPVIDRIQRLISSGIVDRAALAAAQRQFLDLKLEEDRLRAAFEDAQERFEHYFGDSPSSVPAPQQLFSDAELAAMANTYLDAPELVVAAAELIATERALEAAQAERRPTVGLQAGVDSPISETEQADANVGLVLRYTFTNGGRREAEIDRLEERLKAGRAAFENTKSQAEVEVQSALSRYRSLQSTISILDDQIQELNTERNTLRSQIASGQANLRQLVESEVLYYRARARLLEVRGSLRALEVNLAGLTGQLTEKLDIPVETLL